MEEEPTVRGERGGGSCWSWEVRGRKARVMEVACEGVGGGGMGRRIPEIGPREGRGSRGRDLRVGGGARRDAEGLRGGVHCPRADLEIPQSGQLVGKLPLAPPVGVGRSVPVLTLATQKGRMTSDPLLPKSPVQWVHDTRPLGSKETQGMGRTSAV